MAPIIPIRSHSAALSPEAPPSKSTRSRAASVSDVPQQPQTPSPPSPRLKASSAERFLVRPGSTRTESGRSGRSVGTSRTAGSIRTVESGSSSRSSSSTASARSSMRTGRDWESMAGGTSMHEGNRRSFLSALFGEPRKSRRTARRPSASDRYSVRSGSVRSKPSRALVEKRLDRKQRRTTRDRKASHTTQYGKKNRLSPAKLTWYAVDALAYGVIGAATGSAIMGLLVIYSFEGIPIAMAVGAGAAAAWYGMSKYLRRRILGS